MIKINSSLVVALALGVLVAGLTGCKKDGPAERAGRGIDEATEKAGQHIEKAGDKMKDTIDDMKK